MGLECFCDLPHGYLTFENRFVLPPEYKAKPILNIGKAAGEAALAFRATKVKIKAIN